MIFNLCSNSKNGLVVRNLSISDAVSLRDLILKNQEFLRQWLPWLDSEFSLADVENSLTRSIERTASKVALSAGIFMNDRIIGRISFNEIDTANKKAAIGYWISEDVQGKGLATEAVRVLCEYGFTALQLNRLEIHCAVGNFRSQAIATRLGFKQEGVFREAEWLYDHFVDHIVYAKLSCN